VNVAAVILAAGASRRMGQPKQLLPFDGQSLLRRTTAAALTAGCDPVVVALGALRNRLRDELSGLPAIVLDNPDWEQGHGTSMRCGLTAIGTADAVMFLVCDQPFLDAEHLKCLIDAWRESGLPMAASAYAGAIGVPALFDASCFADLRQLPPESGAKVLLLRHRERVTTVSFPGGAFDVDTPEDAQLASAFDDVR